MEGGEEEGELWWYGARGDAFVYTSAFTRTNVAWSKTAIIATICNEVSVQISAITDTETRITVPCRGRIEPNCDSNGDMCIQFPCISNENVQQLLVSCSRTKANGMAVNGGTGIDEVRKVADIVWCYEDTLQLCAANWL